MKIYVSDKAGFCFGVKNAVDKAYNMENDSGNVFTYGPIIHNNVVVNELNNKGIKAIEDIDSLNEKDKVIIRSHGVSKEIYERIEKKGVEIIDATCPYVKNIHNIVQEKYNEGYKIVIIGDETHPEVKGINGWCSNKAIIVNSKQDIYDKINEQFTKICIVSQTTFSVDKWYEIIPNLLKYSKQVLIYNTICSATEMRQKEAEKLSSEVELMIIAGSKESSNTQKLYEICQKNCENVILIESVDEIKVEELKNINSIGLTAGASTPQKTIDEIIDKLKTQDLLSTYEIIKGKTLKIDLDNKKVNLSIKDAQ